jgi:hypothetical protein
LQVRDLRDDRRLLARVLLQDHAHLVPAEHKRTALPPVKLDELGGYIPRIDVERGIGVIPLDHGEVGEGVKQGELVAGDERPLGEKPLNVTEEPDPLLGGRDHYCVSPQ